MTTTGENSHSWHARGKISRHLRTQHSGIELHDHKREAKYRFLDDTRDDIDITEDEENELHAIVRMLRGMSDEEREALIAHSVEDTSDYEDHQEPLRAKKIYQI